MRLVTLDGYTRLSRPRQGWVVHRLIPRPGSVMLMGPPKEGKSFLAMDISFKASRGEDVLGQKTEAGPVLYLQLDTGETSWRDRLESLRRDGYDISGPVYMVHPEDTPTAVNVLAQPGRAWLREAVKSCDPQLIVVDVLREIHTGDENDSTAMKMVGDELGGVFAGRGVLYVHHTRKIPDEVQDPDPAKYARGSSYITGKMDAYWLLWNSTLKIKSRFDDDLKLRAVREDTGMWSFPGIGKDGGSGEALIALCAEFPDLSHSTLAPIARQRFGLSRATYFRRLSGRPCVHWK